MQAWRNCQDLTEVTSDSSAFLNVICLLKLFIQLWTAFFIFHISNRINYNRITEGLL
jgi:hypothetical protein